MLLMEEDRRNPSLNPTDLGGTNPDRSRQTSTQHNSSTQQQRQEGPREHDSSSSLADHFSGEDPFLMDYIPNTPYFDYLLPPNFEASLLTMPTPKVASGADELTIPSFEQTHRQYINLRHEEEHKQSPASELQFGTKRRRSEVSYQTVQDDDGTTGKGCNRWSEREEVFLSGIVMDMYYRRHSLKPTNEEKKVAKDNGESCDMLVWQEISIRYNIARTRYAELTERISPERSIKSLQRHWKETGLKKFMSEPDKSLVPLTKQRERRWDEVYNVNYILSCPEVMYQELIKTEKKQEYIQIHCSNSNKRQVTL